MALTVPIDIIEDIIDQAAGDPRSLRQLALTCSLFLPRSRYHLLAWHVCLRNKSQLEEFYAYLRTNPHMRPIIRVVKLQVPEEIPEGEALKAQELLNMIPVPLLTLPNLRYWGLRPRYSVATPYGSIRSDQLARLGTYTASITTLELHRVWFLNVDDFARYVFAFTALRSLILCDVALWTNEAGVIFWPGKAQLHLTSLHMREKVHESVMALLLEIGQSTIKDLRLCLIRRRPIGEDRIYGLLGSMSVLRSITLQMSRFYRGDVKSFMVDAWKLIKRLSTSPSRTHVIVVDTLGYLDAALTEKPLKKIRRQLERLSLGQPSQSIVVTALNMKRRRKTFWTTALVRYFPELHQQGRFTIQCEESGDAYHMAGHDMAVQCLNISPNGKWVASGSRDATIILWDACGGGGIVREWVAHKKEVISLAFSPDSRLLVSGGHDGSLVIWDIEGDKRIAALEGHTSRIIACAWSPNGSLLASAATNGGLRVWDAQSFTQLRCFEDKDMDQFQFVRFSPDGCRLAFWGRKGCCNIWDTVNGSQTTLNADRRLTGPAAFDPTSRYVVVPAVDYTVHMWDVETGEETFVLRGHTNVVCDVAFSPNGDWVLSASADGTARIWDARTGDKVFSLEGHTQVVNAACFSPDGKYVASASLDSTVRLWDTSDWSSVRVFTEHTVWVDHVLFSPDGETLWSGARDGTVIARHLRDILP